MSLVMSNDMSLVMSYLYLFNVKHLNKAHRLFDVFCTVLEPLYMFFDFQVELHFLFKRFGKSLSLVVVFFGCSPGI